mgnify:CR=1 FL=1
MFLWVGCELKCMSDVVFSKLTSFSTIELVSSSVDVEEYRLKAGVGKSLRQIVRSIENRNYSSGFMQLYVFDGSDEEDELVGVGYIEDWRPMCFPSDVVDDEDARSVHMGEVKDERLQTLREETSFDDEWSVLLDTHDMLAGGGVRLQPLTLRPTSWT